MCGIEPEGQSLWTVHMLLYTYCFTVDTIYCEGPAILDSNKLQSSIKHPHPSIPVRAPLFPDPNVRVVIANHPHRSKLNIETSAAGRRGQGCLRLSHGGQDGV